MTKSSLAKIEPAKLEVEDINEPSKPENAEAAPLAMKITAGSRN